MARQVKCPVCGKLNSKEDTVEKNKRYYCPDCLNSQTQKTDSYKKLMEYVCELFEIATPSPLILKQIKDYRDNYGYTYDGMRATLQYFFETENHSTSNCEGVGIIPFAYDKTKNFYAEKKEIKKQLEECDFNEVRNKKNIIQVIKREDSQYEDKNLIKIEDIIEEEEL